MPQITIVPAPELPNISSKAVTIFLAGTTTATDSEDWRDALISKVRAFQFPRQKDHSEIVIVNPVRKDWDSSWTNEMMAEQTNWELDMQEAADVIVLFFQSVTAAPISLLELGLAARTGKAVVYASPEYSKRVNVEAVCRKFAVPFTGELSELEHSLHKKIASQQSKD